METKVKYVIVGLFVILLGATSIGVFLWMSRGLERTVYERYNAYFRESVSGLNPNAPVKFRGVDVGRVKEIVINPKNIEEVRLSMEIAQGTPVKTDTVATLQIQGLTGLAFVNLSGGSQAAPRLKANPGEPYPVIRTGPSLLFRLDSDMTNLIAGVNAFTEDARAVIDEENRRNLRQILGDLAVLTHTLAKRSETVDEGVVRGAEAMRNIARITEQLHGRLPVLLDNVASTTASLKGTAVTIDAAGMEVARAGRELGDMAKENRPNIERFTRQSLPEVGLLITELRQLTHQLQRLARQLEQEPNSAIFGRPPVPPGPGE
ncbi:MAG: MCE family protein [Deltaproteobacteria bacterium]|nr:MCE family protein [Deltaproteobacteria bacterium]PWB62659.1 MAG: MCE family protein [Deltaproteobacteria bacterium]